MRDGVEPARQPSVGRHLPPDGAEPDEPHQREPGPRQRAAEPDDDALVLGEPDMLTPEDVRRAVPQAEPIDPHMIVAEDRFPDVLAERWKPCPQCGEDVDRECPICDGLGRVLATDSEQTEPKPAPASGDDLGVYKGMADSYRNDAEPTGAPYGIIDPDYGRVYTIARKLAWEEGYAIGLHGSFTRDLDLIAVPWAERACEAEHLIRRIVDATGLKLRDGVAVKPHGRRAWTLLFPTFGDPRFVDLSVMPRGRLSRGESGCRVNTCGAYPRTREAVMSTNDGGPAFPHDGQHNYTGGMTLRDYFAAQAMQAFIGKLVNGDETSSALIPELSYAMADVMLKAREGA